MSDDKAGMIETKSGELVEFDTWYLLRFNEEPTRENIRKRLECAK